KLRRHLLSCLTNRNVRVRVPSMNDDKDDPEFAINKAQYDSMQQAFDIALDGSFVSLSDEERAELEAEVAALNQESVNSALSTLILRHPTEFHELLREQRDARGISDQLRSDYSDMIVIAERNA